MMDEKSNSSSSNSADGSVLHNQLQNHENNETDISTFYVDASRSIIIVETVISVYILIVLSLHTWRNRHRQNVPKVNHLCLLSAVFLVLLCLNAMAEYWIGEVISCWSYYLSRHILYGVGCGLVYTFLWARQRKLYSDDLLIHTVSRCSFAVSTSIIFGIYCFILCFCVIFSTFKYESNMQTKHICKLISTFPLDEFTLGIIFVSICWFFQTVLFILTIYPLVGSRCKSQRKFSVLCCSSPQNDILKLLKRLAFCVFVCTFSSLCIAAVMLSFPLMSPSKFIPYGLLTVLDFLINTVAVACNFVDWRQRLFPMFS